jgi:hypothetical protein
MSDCRILLRLSLCLLLSLAGGGLAALLLTQGVLAAEGTRILPGQKDCQSKLPDHISWSEQEIWAWEKRICLGKPANLLDFEGSMERFCDPGNADAWPKTRNIRSVFVELLLNHEPYRSAMTRGGLIIQCANFSERLNLSNIQTRYPLMLDMSRFRQPVTLDHYSSKSLLSFQKSHFDGDFSAQGLQLEGSLFLRGGTQFQKFSLANGKIGENLEVTGATFNGEFVAPGVEVRGDLYLDGGATFRKLLRLDSAKIGRNIRAVNSLFEGELNANALQASGSLFLTLGSRFMGDVNLVGARVSQNVQTNGAVFEGTFQASMMEVSDGLFMSDGAEFQDVSLIGTKVGFLEVVLSRFSSGYLPHLRCHAFESERALAA